MRKAPANKSVGTRRWRVRTLSAVAAVAVLPLISWGGYAFFRHTVEQQAEHKLEQVRQTVEADANRKVMQAEQQRAAALNAAEQERQARVAAEAEAKRKADQERQAKAAAEAEAKRIAEKAEQQRSAALKAEQEHRATAAAEAKRMPEQAEQQRLAALKAEQERQAKAAAEAAALKAGQEQRATAAERTGGGGGRGGGGGGLGAEQEMPQFPWPPPAASAFYVLPDNLFESRRTVGEVVGAIISALERNGYVERSFFRIEKGGLALITRLERISDDGSSFAEPQRWPRPRQTDTADLARFLRGLFFIDRGHYRVIVFILRDLPFSQSSQAITRDDARTWLRTGANTLPSEIAKEPYGGAHCTVLVYEFASDGTAVRVVESQLTGKQHLTKAGLLSLLEKN